MMGRVFKRTLQKSQILEAPLNVCQTKAGQTYVLDSKIFEGFGDLNPNERIELMKGYLGWLTLQSSTLFSEVGTTEETSAATILNAMIGQFCNHYHGLYPGVYVQADKPSQM